MSYTTTSYYKTSGPPGMSRGSRGGYVGPPRGAPRGAPRGRGSSEGGWSSRGMSRGRGYHQGGYQPRGGPGGHGGHSGHGGMQSGSSHTGQWRGHQDSSSQQGGYRNDRYPSAGSRPSDSRYPSTRGGGSVDYNRRYTQRDTPPSYSSSREHHRSPEPVPRKRMRTEGYSPATSRRSHEGGYEYSSSRYEYGSDKGSYSNEDRGRPVYREERRPSADRRDDYHSPRSREPSGSSMPPPAAPTRGVGTYRVLRGRGIARSYPARRPTEVSSSLAARKRTLIESYTKRRILTGRSQDYYKKLKSIKLRSAALMSARRDGIKSEPGNSEDELENWDDEPDKDNVSDSEEKHKTGDECDDDVDGEDAPEKKVVRKLVKKVVVKKKVISTEDGGEGSVTVKTEEDEAGEEDPVDGEEAVEEEMETDVDGNKEPKMQVTIKQDSEMRAVSDEGARKTSSGKPGYKFIKLLCPHCKDNSITFKEYQNHLRGLHHVNAMRKLSFRLKQNLARMRVEQRIQQRLDEKNDEIRGVATGRTSYCHTCKLNYRQERTRHVESEMHKKMKEFLMPTCVICRINFRSPMLFENHICSLEHIKMEERFMMGRGRDMDRPTEKEVDMDSLLVLDSVGSADESDSDDEAMDEKSEGKDGDKRERKKKAQINLGADYVKKVEVMYCELCAIYLPRTGEEDVALANHCRTRNHLQRYVRYKDDRALRKEAERIHRRDKAEQEARSKAQETNKETKTENSSSEAEKTPVKGDEPENKQDKGTGSSTGNEGANDSADLDDKIWADVDKGLDELLREVEPGNKSSDDDDESGRYDRFRYSDKKGGKASSEDREAGETSTSSLTSATEAVPKQEVTSPKEN